MLLEIVKYGDPVLRQKAMPVVAVTSELVEAAQNMLETMHHARGVGLAAQQVGSLNSMCVIDVPLDCEEDDETQEFNAQVAMPLVMFNPVIVSTTGEQGGKEGCLSFPNMSAPLVRPAEVTCQYTDENGMVQMVTARGFLARAILHETDHLNGVLYVDHLAESEKDRLAKRLQKLAKKNGGTL